MFKVGQKVVCIKSNKQKTIKKGRIYVVRGLVNYSCGCVVVDVGVRDFLFDINTCKCGISRDVNKGILLYYLHRFRPLESKKVKHKFKVDIKLKEPTHETVDAPILEPEKMKLIAEDFLILSPK